MNVGYNDVNDGKKKETNVIIMTVVENCTKGVGYYGEA